MTQFTLRTFDIPNLHRHAIGFDQMFEQLNRTFANSKSDNYPPHNVVQLDDTHFVIELAVAGFSKDEIDISVNDGNLVIKGNKIEKEEKAEYLYKGIGTRSFTKTLRIADTVEVKGAEFKDGILKIGLENIIPEHKKPKKIEIGTELKSFRPQLLQEEKVA